MGCNCLLAELRGYGQSSGEAQLGKMLTDVVPTVEALGRDPQDLIFFGRSVGSIFALEAADRFPRAAGLILESGVADVLERLLLRVSPSELGASFHDLEKEVAKRLNHREKIAGFTGPVLILHTENDGLVDVSHARNLYAWATGEKTLHLFPEGDHNSIMYVNSYEYFALLHQFISNLP